MQTKKQCSSPNFAGMANRPFNVPFQKLGRTVQNINRIREVIRVLVSHGFEDIVANSPLRRFVPRQQQLNWTRQEKPVLEFTRYERLRLVIEELGPTFIKLGQMISNRPELMPEGLLREFEKLHDRVPPFDAETARLIVERETGKSIQELFVYFDDIPIGRPQSGRYTAPACIRVRMWW